MSFNVSQHVLLMQENVCNFTLLSFLKICHRFAPTSENVLKTCIAFEEESRWGCFYKIEFDCINVLVFVIMIINIQ